MRISTFVHPCERPTNLPVRFASGYLMGEIIAIQMREMKFPEGEAEEALIHSMVVFGKRNTMTSMEDWVAKLFQAGHTKIIKHVYARVNEMPLDDPELAAW